MGFLLAKGKKKTKSESDAASARGTTDHSGSKSKADVHVHSNTRGAIETTLLSRREKLLNKVMRKRAKSNRGSETPTVGSTLTPATTAMGRTPVTEHWITGRDVEIALGASDETESVMEERELIRQQLFYEDQGVEVAVQFSPKGTTLYPVTSVQKMGHQPQSSPPRSRYTRSKKPAKEEEEKKEDVAPPTVVSPEPEKQSSGTNKSKFEKDSPLPSTPSMEPSEIDPLEHFPAVAAAVAKAEASRPRALGAEHATVTSSWTVVTPPTPSSPERPFDEVEGPEDPTIAEIENAASKQESANNEKSVIPKEDTNGERDEEEEEEKEGITRKLLDVFNCGDDFTEFSGTAMQNMRSCRLVDAFYDNACWTYRDAAAVKRPYYNENFAQRFLKDITQEGINVLWHVPPSQSTDDGTNWSGRSVVMQIKSGSCYSKNDIEPKLQWKPMSGGQNSDILLSSISLLDIQSIATFVDTICENDDEEMFADACGAGMEEDICLFAITTNEGDVHVFEATSPRERDLLVAGLKNVIARLSFHLIVGDAGASCELYTEEVKNLADGELPANSNPTKNMNRIAHVLLD